MADGIAVRIDIEQELAAAARGECLACRIGARHKEDDDCPKTREVNLTWCTKGRHAIPLVRVRGRLMYKGTCSTCGSDDTSVLNRGR